MNVLHSSDKLAYSVTQHFPYYAITVTLATLYDQKEALSVQVHDMNRDVLKLTLSRPGSGDHLSREMYRFVERASVELVHNKLPGKTFVSPTKLLTGLWPRVFNAYQLDIQTPVNGGAALLEFV